jgi:hypothetical protein
VYVAKLLSLSVFNMLVTVPGDTPSAAASCPVAAGFPWLSEQMVKMALT